MDAVVRIESAILHHRDAIKAAGEIRVDERDSAAADAKQAADQRLWDAVDG